MTSSSVLPRERRGDWLSLLESHAAELGEKPALVFLEDGLVETGARSYAQLATNARRIAARLQSRGIDRGPVLLFYPQGLEFVDAFFGAIFAGAVPVPAFAPNAHRENFRRMESIVRDSGAGAIMTDAASATILRGWAAESPTVAAPEIIETDGQPAAEPPAWRRPDVSADGVAFMQYTSGSTSTPKGVVVSHANLLANAKLLASFYRQDASSTFVSWVPIYHDLGLIGNILFSLYLGAKCVAMAPETFVRNPLNWLNAIHAYRATISFAPTFAYDYSVPYAKALAPEQLDFRSWDVAVIGAEPVYRGTIERFSRAFAPFGFRQTSFQCAYGLAESTLMIVTTPHGTGPVFKTVDASALERDQIVETTSEDPADCRSVVSSGLVGAEHRAAVVDPRTRQRCPDLRVGEVWLSGPSITAGYFRNPAGTHEGFENRLDDDPAVTYLRSGDLGFLENGQLYITGRMKDVIIVNGANHYPQDVEQTVCAADPALRPGCAAAFALVENEREQVVAVAEVRKQFIDGLDAPAVFKRIARQVEAVHRLSLRDIVLVPPGHLSKTSSGKTQRQLMKERYASGDLAAIARMQPAREEAPADDAARIALRNWIHFTIAELAGMAITAVDLDNHITQVGMDSVKVVNFLGRAAAHLGVADTELRPWEFDSVNAWIATL